ncbi:hypothetical protein E5D57_009710 [Metarhizium anisopliae]|nr:hypothetical protein E5D57_009710 [Metarhizium anisopliae]
MSYYTSGWALAAKQGFQRAENVDCDERLHLKSAPSIRSRAVIFPRRLRMHDSQAILSRYMQGE